MEKVHQFARDLRPPLLDDLGLIDALHAHMKDFTKRTGIPVEFTVSAAVQEMESDKRTVIYRVVQEALANISSHARASHVSVKIRKIKDLVCLQVKDNGKGFDVGRRLAGKKITRLGLLGMRGRVEMFGGRFEISSVLQQGTTLRAEMPFGRVSKAPRAATASQMDGAGHDLRLYERPPVD
jgi:signal transduction histidine kinase